MEAGATAGHYQYKLLNLFHMKQKDLNEVFDMMNNEVMDKTRELLTSLFNRAVFVKAIVDSQIGIVHTPDEIPDFENWEQLFNWIMVTDFEDVVTLTRYFFAILHDHRDLPDFFVEFFPK